MKIRTSLKLLAIILSGFWQPAFTQTSYKKISFQKTSAKIVVELHLPQSNGKDSAGVSFMAIDKVPGYWDRKDDRIKLINGVAKWSIESSLPYVINTREFLMNQNAYWVAEPGDSVVIISNGAELKFSGKGAEKFELQNRIKLLNDSLKRTLSNTSDYYTESLEDYLQWNNYLKNLSKTVSPLIELYRNKISGFAFNYLRDIILDNIVDNFSDKFSAFRSYAKKSGKFSRQDINNIYDSTYAVAVSGDKLPSMSRPFLGSWRPVMFHVLRKYSFNSDAPPLNSKLNRHLLYLEQGLKEYTGYVREKFLEEFLTGEMIEAFGFVPEVEAALTRYYAEPGYPEHKKYVKDFEKEYRTLIPGKPAPDFTLTDISGRQFSKEDMKEKVVLMDFWFTGCVGCVSMTPVIRRIEEKFKNDSNVVFLGISVDKSKSKWTKSLAEGKYSTGKGINLYTGGEGEDHPITKKYGINDYPALYLLSGAGNIAENPLPDPRSDNGEQLIRLIERQLVLLKDGPYILRDKDTNISYTLNGPFMSSKRLDDKKQVELAVSTDIYQENFTARLKQSMAAEPSEFVAPPRILALSDIEGNFDAFRKLLQANGVVDKNYEWTFGKGHLVFCGDMFDRGEQVTECLWLIYSLEEKAKAAGGYVHFILGNHEIMNLSGDHRYAKDKYLDNAGRIGKTYADLYDTNSELGRWLRTKNIIEKIGDLLFVHGGVCKEVSELPLTILEMNKLARPWLDKDSIAQQSTDKNLALLFNYTDKRSPFWYRDYYLEQEMKILGGGKKGIDTLYKTSDNVIEKVLAKFGVSRIITGHTIIAPNGNAGDTISVHYDGKVLNMDTRHALGRSEALLVEGDKFYRVNDKGDKVALYIKPREYNSR